jgi:carboxylesterase type B
MTSTERPAAVTESGGVQGTVEDSVAAFRGIPFAASPVGDRRFAALDRSRRGRACATPPARVRPSRRPPPGSRRS